MSQLPCSGKLIRLAIGFWVCFASSLALGAPAAGWLAAGWLVAACAATLAGSRSGSAIRTRVRVLRAQRSLCESPRRLIDMRFLLGALRGESILAASTATGVNTAV